MASIEDEYKKPVTLIYLDLLKILASFMVIMLHVSAQNWYSTNPISFEWKVFNVSDSMVRSSVPLFFMISGALFLRKKEINIKRIFNHNILHLFIVYITWSILYAIYQLGIHNISTKINLIPITILNSHWHLWFLPVMLSIYVLIPVLYSLVHYGEGKFIKYYLLVFFIFGIMKTTLFGIPNLNNYISIFAQKLSVELCQYCGYFILGYWLTTLNTYKIKNRYLLFVFLITLFIGSSIDNWYSVSNGTPMGTLYDYFCLPIFIEGVSLFIIFKNLGDKVQFGKKTERFIKTITSCTLGIYLLHVFIYEQINIRLGLNSLSFNPLLSIPLICIITFIICFFIIFILKKIPIIGKWTV